MSQSPDTPPSSRPTTRRVLVVDDEPTLRLGFSYALRNPSTQVDTAVGGGAALELVEDHRYDAMFLDLRMPDIDGLKVIKTLREVGNPIPVVLCSAFVTLDSALVAVRNRVVDFLIKPVCPADLRHALAYVTGDAANTLAKALAFARKGRFEDAVALLSCDEMMENPRAQLWRHLLELAYRGSSPDEARRVLGEKVSERIALQAGIE